MDLREVTEQEVPQLSEILRLAFVEDPTWGPALDSTNTSPSFLTSYWQTYLEGALPWSNVFTNSDATALAVWLPWGAPELSDAQEQSLRELVVAHLPEEASADLFELWERLEQHHPHDKPHAYLSLLATHPTHAGKGLGQQLLAACLEHYDHDGTPTFLESSNIANNRRYERAGYKAIGGFRAVRDDAWITTMWRDPR